MSARWVRGEDARHMAWGDAAETACSRPLGGNVRRYSLTEANCEDCRNAFLLLNLNLLGSGDARPPTGGTPPGERA